MSVSLTRAASVDEAINMLNMYHKQLRLNYE